MAKRRSKKKAKTAKRAKTARRAKTAKKATRAKKAKTAKKAKKAKTARKSTKGTRGASAKTSTKVDRHPVVAKLGPTLGAGLKRVLQRHSKGGRYSLAGLPSNDAQIKLTEVELDGYTYVLTRIRRIPEDSLTDRQKQIAVYVANGLSNKGIADKLRISPATVAAHLRTIFTKLRLSSRTALAKHALGFC